jgi:diguanylate cyclase (GGDEF)-like protein
MTRVPSCRAVLACAAVLILAAHASAHALAQTRAADLPIAPMLATVNPHVLLGAATLTVTGLLCLLYFYRRRLYILYWIAGWSLATAGTFLVAREYPNPKLGAALYGISQFLGIISALVFVISADAYRTRPRLRRGYVIVLLPVLIWFALAPIALGANVVYATGHLLIAGGFVAAGGAHLALLRQTRLLGAAVVGTTMLGVAASNGWVALVVHDSGAAVGRMAFVNLALYLVTALGMQLMTFEDMTYELRVANKRLESAQAELRELVTTDALTGCRNRRFFAEVIGREIQRHRRYRIPLSMLFVDVDRFKAVNDTLGHEEGDRVLQRVAAFLIRNVREVDYVFRWGGDEFLVLISCREDEAARKKAELQAAFSESLDATSMPASVDLSIGCAEVPVEATDIMAIVKIADERMYLDKKR